MTVTVVCKYFRFNFQQRIKVIVKEVKQPLRIAIPARNDALPNYQDAGFLNPF